MRRPAAPAALPRKCIGLGDLRLVRVERGRGAGEQTGRQCGKEWRQQEAAAARREVLQVRERGYRVGTSGKRRGSPWKPRISISSSRSEGAVTVVGMPPWAEPKVPSAVPAKPPAGFCM